MNIGADIAIATEENEASEKVAMVQVETLDQFANLMVSWHQRQVKILKHMATIPEGTEMGLEGEEAIVLEGSTLHAFQMGLTVALAHVGELPFVFTTSEPDDAKP